jgi:hypothetical protein
MPGALLARRAGAGAVQLAATQWHGCWELAAQGVELQLREGYHSMKAAAALSMYCACPCIKHACGMLLGRGPLLLGATGPRVIITRSPGLQENEADKLRYDACYNSYYPATIQHYIEGQGEQTLVRKP